MAKPSSITCSGTALRKFRESDLEFLYRVYASTRADEMAMIVDWSRVQKEAFLRSQFQAQHRYYQENYPNASYDIIVNHGRDIGRFYVERMNNEIRIMDIALLPEERNRGLGRALMQAVLDEAVRTRRFVSLHVEERNPAMRLYKRMGFMIVGEVSFYKLMHWFPEGLTPVLESGSPVEIAGDFK
jgi:ribosomal protein S18 acetylase RimI-like enzyme